MSNHVRVAAGLLGHPIVRQFKADHGMRGLGALLSLILMTSGKRGRIGVDTSSELAELLGWDGEPGELARILHGAGLVKPVDGTLLLVPWREFYPHEVRAMALSETNRRNVLSRHRKAKLAPPPEPEPVPEPVQPPPDPAPPPKPEKFRPDYEAIVGLYYKHLPNNPTIHKISPSIRSAIDQRIRDDAERKDIGWWDDYFRHAGSRHFITGRIGDRPFYASLPWLLGPKNMDKVLNGYYPEGDD